MKFKKNNLNRIWIVLFAVLFFLYGYEIRNFFLELLSNVSLHFGYLDVQENWDALDHFVKGDLFFKDYFYQYGWFILFLQSIPYTILHQTFFAELFSRFVFLPILALLIAFVVAKNVFHKWHFVFIFLFFGFLFNVDIKLTSIRHAMAALSLSFFILFFRSKKSRYLFIAGVISGLSVLASIEYAVALYIALLAGIFIAFIAGNTFITFRKIFWFFLGASIVLIPTLIFSIQAGTFANYVRFMSAEINNFYYASPCSANSFPRISDLKTTVQPIDFLRQLNMYVVFVFYCATALVLLFKYVKKRTLSQTQLVQMIILIYGSLIYIRTMDNPCIGFFTLGLTPFFLLLTFSVDFLIEQVKKAKSRLFSCVYILLLITIFAWFLLTQDLEFISRIFSFKKTASEVKQNLAYDAKVGWFIDTSYSKEYSEITRYITKNTPENDYLYVYPWGPYNILSGRNSPNSVLNAFQFLAGEEYEERTLKELEEKKPKVVVVNIFNNLGKVIYTTEKTTYNRYLSRDDGVGLVFLGIGNRVEIYILENYDIVLRNKKAVVLKRRKTPLPLKQSYKKIHQTGDMNFAKPIEATDVEIEFKVDGDIFTKHLSKYFAEFTAAFETGDGLLAHSTGSAIVTKDFQKVRISLPEKKQVKKLSLNISESKGLLWWIHPYSINIQKITFYEWIH